jgi:2-polyprenyl-3-methyl-5-hydroxy-6-metoxy-1,4-benzoquinol methylase
MGQAYSFIIVQGYQIISEGDVNYMNNRNFYQYKSEILANIKEVLSEAEPGSFNEAAFPAYSHQNPVINALFWARLRAAIKFLEKKEHPALGLDFGCGSGVMLPFLSSISQEVVGVDIDIKPITQMQACMKFADNIKVIQINDPALPEIKPATLDFIVALDVLEHVPNLDETIDMFYSKLKPDGLLIVSGPTENLMYHIGRKLAGPEFTGDYHHRNIHDIKKSILREFEIFSQKKLVFPVILFEIYACTPKGSR